ncbi:MAG TPA: flagellar basal body P-ring formation chaperone FlgA [Bryobacteraceae bacterium]|nr:flagellar basal body P-ring formation chaperone FlgA [Bryobacteraceae bacterium]
MKFRVLVALGWTAWFAPAQVPSCRPVGDDRILARDLAAVLPEFAAAPADALVGQAPVPGAQRVFHASELRMLAHRFGVVLSAADDICFAWPLAPLDRAQAVAAMQNSLQVPGIKIEIAQTISDRVPKGRIEFPLSGLGTPQPADPTGPVFWRGDVIYGNDHRFAVWVRAALSVPCRKLIATENLRAGQPLAARQVRAIDSTCFPVGAKEVSLDQVAGLLPIHAIAARTELRLDLLTPPNDINRGDDVQVEVRSGNARVGLTARAVTGGRSGDTISVRNPQSNRIFQVRITGKDTAVVEAGGGI